MNKAFGTAIKFWAPNPWTTLGMYALLSYLSWRIIQQWPSDSGVLMEPVPEPKLPFTRSTDWNLPLVLPDLGKRSP